MVISSQEINKVSNIVVEVFGIEQNLGINNLFIFFSKQGTTAQHAQGIVQGNIVLKS